MLSEGFGLRRSVVGERWWLSCHRWTVRVVVVDGVVRDVAPLLRRWHLGGRWEHLQERARALGGYRCQRLA